MHTCIFINIHMHVYINSFIYSCINICIHKFAHVLKNIHTFICWHMHIYLYLYTCTLICTIMHACVHAHIHVFMNIYTHVYIPLRTELGFLLVFYPYGDNYKCLGKAAVSRSVFPQHTCVKPNPHTKTVTSRAFGVWLGHWGLPFTDAGELSFSDQGHHVWEEDFARRKSARTLMWSFPPQER